MESVKSKKKKKKKEWVQCFFTIGIWNQWLVVESVKSITSFYCPAVPELYGSLKCAFWLLTWKFCLLDDVLLVNSVLCMIADHGLVFGRCRNKEPHSSYSLCLGVAAIKNHTPPVFSCVVWLLSGTKRSGNKRKLNERGGLTWVRQSKTLKEFSWQMPRIRSSFSWKSPEEFEM